MELLYSGDTAGAIEKFREVQREQPAHPLGYLLELDAQWWRIYCSAIERRWELIGSWRRAKQPEDDAYFLLAERAIALAEAQFKKTGDAEMRLYAGMGWALKARLYALRGENRGVARSGVNAREHFLRALELDKDLPDALTGLGLYNYYVDTLSTLAKVLRFFMGIPGGSKKEGMQQLETAMARGELTSDEARFYLAVNLRDHEEKYQRAIELMAPLVEKYPRNPVFHLLLGDMHAKLAHREPAAEQFRLAQQLSPPGSGCAARLKQVAQTGLASLPATAKAR